jgi:hypothetical protein
MQNKQISLCFSTSIQNGGVTPRCLTVTLQPIYRRERALGVNWLAHRIGVTDGVDGVGKNRKLYASAGNGIVIDFRLLTALGGLQIDR